jgi:hypothetical protein
MLSLRTEMKELRIILALACSFAACAHAAAQVRASGRASGAVFRDCRRPGFSAQRRASATRRIFAT